MEKNRLGKRINTVRKDRGFTADRLSELCHINATYLRQIEGGAKMPSLPVFIDIRRALKISPDCLLQDELGGNEIHRHSGDRNALERGFPWQTGACPCHDQSSAGVR